MIVTSAITSTELAIHEVVEELKNYDNALAQESSQLTQTTLESTLSLKESLEVISQVQDHRSYLTSVSTALLNFHDDKKVEPSEIELVTHHQYYHPDLSTPLLITYRNFAAPELSLHKVDP